MKQYKKLLSVLLVLVLILCLLPSTALAASKGSDAKTEEAAAEEETVTTAEEAAETETEAAEEPTETVDGEEAEVTNADAEADKAAAEAEALAEEQSEPETEAEVAAEEETAEAAAEPAEEESPAEDAVMRTLSCNADETAYAEEGDMLYCNGGTVFNNGGLVYNNAGIVYNNGGTVYNNAGTVYSNGGVVYNNAGSVYNNGSTVYTNGGSVEDSVIYGYNRVTLGGDYSAFAEITGLELEPGSEDSLIVGEDAVVTIVPKDGFQITSIEADAGKLEKNKDGSYALSEVDSKLALNISFQAQAPEISLPSGTYGTEQTVEITAAEGAEIYFSTDGNEPGEENSQLYEEPITVSEGMTISAVAVVEGAELSDTVSASYAILSLTPPVFDDMEEGYKQPAAQGVLAENKGSVDATVKSVSIDDEADAFLLNRDGTGKIKAGESNTALWTVRPASRLGAGTYKAILTFTFDSGEKQEVPVSFTVAAPAETAEEETEEAAAEPVEEAAAEDAEPAEEAEAEEAVTEEETAEEAADEKGSEEAAGEETTDEKGTESKGTGKVFGKLFGGKKA